MSDSVVEVDERCYAHTLPDRPPSDWELVGHHLDAVGDLAGTFAARFGAGEWGELCGRWHDLGKFSVAFQAYIQRSSDPDAGDEGTTGRVDHSTFGAQHACRALANKQAGWILAYCIAGHHAGLADGSASKEEHRRSSLAWRLKSTPPHVPGHRIPETTVRPPTPPFRPALAIAGFQMAFFTRMLFSTLVDADRTATERFVDPERALVRVKPKPSLKDLAAELDRYLDGLQANAAATAVNDLRGEVLRQCRVAADRDPGFFSLNVPTGGGKTLSSLAFALRHAIQHDLDRVIVAIPFTSIIDQTADVYREALGDLAPAVLEHHSAVESSGRTRESELAKENWDAPVIVTTNVQVLETLFASAATPCRKLHRIARSVIVLDEAQMLPVDLLEPTLAALTELVEHYGCSVVLCTATQPALERRNEFRIGVAGVRPIIEFPVELFERLRRVDVKRLGRVSDDQLASRLLSEPQVLCIVNTRAHAAALFDRVIAGGGSETTYHLSTLMCAAHRRDVLARVRQALVEGRDCRVVSTPLIEAGVDVDFPVVYRAPAGFDSIAQAAGRCNREGKLGGTGLVWLFKTEAPPPNGLPRAAAQIGQELSHRFPDPLHPAAIEAYFRQLYWSQSHRWDARGVMACFADDLRRLEVLFQFRTAALAYRLIPESQAMVLVPFGAPGRQLRDRFLRGAPVDYLTHREAQPFLVGVWPEMLRELTDAGTLVDHVSGVHLLMDERVYTVTRGLTRSGLGIDPGMLIQ